MIEAYERLLKENMWDIDFYVEHLIYMIDMLYSTCYRKNEMNDDLQQKLFELTSMEEYSNVYVLACTRYPKIKTYDMLLPIPYVDMFYIFDKLFENIVKHESRDVVKHKLMSLFPECEKMISKRLSDEPPGEGDLFWILPYSEALKCYNLYTYMNKHEQTYEC